MLERLHFNKDTMRELLKIALPMVVSQGAFAVMIFTDRYFMSQIDPTHMAAALGGGVACFFSFCFFSGLLSYGNAMAAQYLGADEPEKCPKVVTQGFIMAMMSIPALVVITYFVSGIFENMGHDSRQVELERTYYTILMLGIVVTLAKICLSSYFAGIARTHVVMICDVFGRIINVPLSYVMVFGKLGFPALGIVGAGVSTIVATILGFLAFVSFYLAKEHREKFRVMESFHLDWGILRRFLRLGFPSGMELFLNVAAFNLFLLMFQSYGVAQGAAAAIVFNWDILSFVPMIGLNISSRLIPHRGNMPTSTLDQWRHSGSLIAKWLRLSSAVFKVARKRSAASRTGRDDTPVSLIGKSPSIIPSDVAKPRKG